MMFGSKLSTRLLLPITQILLAITLMVVDATPVVTFDNVTWKENPTESDMWETKYYPGYQKLLDNIKDKYPDMYSQLTSLLGNSGEIPKTYDPSWVKSADSALISWEKDNFDSDQLAEKYYGLPIPSVVTDSAELKKDSDGVFNVLDSDTEDGISMKSDKKKGVSNNKSRSGGKDDEDDKKDGSSDDNKGGDNESSTGAGNSLMSGFMSANLAVGIVALSSLYHLLF
ncbi:hypothetical protein H4219_004443 [Mycoemilia scoparia]|uniref:Uncharacterized protein n=1 Tax=Mycoemilia scoparia TaxID=417184 RepID=A0A9W7ZSC0_9FUNG|nr:hypothetical protein H4219_004443 [Mycoemilia scoparia]